MTEMEPWVIDGPVASGPANGLIYEITLASGAIATGPASFPTDSPQTAERQVIVSESGQVIAAPVT